jgi:hypothetical protein
MQTRSKLEVVWIHADCSPGILFRGHVPGTLVDLSHNTLRQAHRSNRALSCKDISNRLVCQLRMDLGMHHSRGDDSFLQDLGLLVDFSDREGAIILLRIVFCFCNLDLELPSALDGSTAQLPGQFDVGLNLGL